MREYSYTLAERRRRAENERRRYWSNPEVRLATINRYRRSKGYPPRASLDEVAPFRGKQVEA
jgi:hypothetical protein